MCKEHHSKKQRKLSHIASFRRRWTEFFRLLGYYAALNGPKPTFRNHLSVPSYMINLTKEELDPWRRDQYVVPKRRFKTTLRRVKTQKTEEFSPN